MTRAVGCLVALLLGALGAIAGALQVSGNLGTGDASSGSPPAAGALVQPVLGAVVTQGFGCTALAIEPVDAGCPAGHVHTGVDLAAPRGTPVVASLGGLVHVVRSRGGYGLHLLVTTPAGPVTLYGHLDDVLVADGDEVAAGETVGTVGSTGNSTGPHLHFEIRVAGNPVDPRALLSLP